MKMCTFALYRVEVCFDSEITGQFNKLMLVAMRWALLPVASHSSYRCKLVVRVGADGGGVENNAGQSRCTTLPRIIVFFQ